MTAAQSDSSTAVHDLQVALQTRANLHTCLLCLVHCALQGLVGALGTTPTSYTIPAIVWLKLKKPAAFSTHWIACWVTIVLSVAVGLLGAVGSIYVLALNAKTYGVFQ